MAVRWRPLLWLLGFGALWLPVLDDPALHSGAYLQAVTTESAVVCAVTADDADMSVQVTDANGTVVAQRTSRGRRHAMRIDGLQPGTEYGYEVRDGGATFDRGRLRTAPADDRAPVRFAVIGDSGDLPWWIWLQRMPLFHVPARWQWFGVEAVPARVGTMLHASRPDFLLHVGDIVYPKGKQSHYAAGFFAPFAAVLRDAPCYAILGNHDIMDDGGRAALANLRLPRNGPTGDGRSYSLAWGAVRVIVLDLNHAVAAGDAEVEFARSELREATEPWVVVASHYPILSASQQGGDRADLIEHLLPVLEQGGCDLYLCGHDHTYQRLQSDAGLTLVVSGAGGKSLYPIDPRPHPASRVAISQFHHCVVEAQSTRFRLTAHSVDDERLDWWELRVDEARLRRIGGINPARAARIAALLR